MTRLVVSLLNTRRPLALAAVLVGTALTASSQLTAQGAYTFAVVAPSGAALRFGSGVAVNNPGEVAFVGTTPQGVPGVYRGDGGSLTLLYAPAIGEPPPTGYLAINAAGTVAFGVAWGLSGGGPQVVLSDGSASTHVNGPWSPSGWITVNDAAEFVYAIQSGPDSGVGLGAAITPLVATGDSAPGGTLTGAAFPRVNNLGQVVFMGVVSDGTARYFRTSTTPGGPVSDVALSRLGGTLFGLNDLGKVAYYGTPPGGAGPAAIYVSDGVVEIPVVVATSNFLPEPHMTPINDLGHVAFVAQDAGAVRRIYVWNGNGLWDVVGQGDTIPSLGTVLDFAMNNDSLNDRDQVAFTVRYDDGSGVDKYGVVRADPVNLPPTAADGALSTNEDAVATGTFSGADPHGDPLAFAIVGNGALGTATVTDASTGAFSYTPNPDASGTDTLTFAATDGTFVSNVGTVTVTITPVNDAPVATSAAVLAVTGATVTGVLQGADVDGPALTYSIVSAASLGQVLITNASTGAFQYIPPQPSSGNIVVPLASLVDTLTFKVSDGSLDSNLATVMFTLRIDEAPFLPDVRLRTQSGRAAAGRLAIAGESTRGASFEVVSSPVLGTVTLGRDGRFVYRPKPGVRGVDHFGVRARVGRTVSNVAEVTVAIASRTPSRP